MSTARRRKNISITRHLVDTPYEYDFAQAVRILERSVNYGVLENIEQKIATGTIAQYRPPRSEFIRFHTHQSLGFPASEIEQITIGKKKSDASQWRMSVNFMGLTGSSGVLPYHYTETVLQRVRLKDRSIVHFFDLFNHRLVSLFYQASVKYRLPIEYERKKLQSSLNEAKDTPTSVLLSLIGLGTPYLTKRLYTKDESLLYYSGLFTNKIRTASGLKQIIRHHFGIPVEIKEFIGQWQELIRDVRTRLPGHESPKGQNNQLGRSAILGRKGWFAQGKIRIILGPLDESQLHNFAPGTTTLQALDELVRLYVNMEQNYDFIMRLYRKDVPERIQLNNKKPPITSWNTWLSSTSGKYNSSNETVDIPVSSRRVQ